MLLYLIIHSLAVIVTEWCTKRFSHSTDMTQTSYIQHPVYDCTETETKGIFGSKFLT